MTRADFDAAMASNDVSWFLEHTFLARVPDLVASGMPIPDAIAAAKARDDELCLMMIAPADYWQEQAAAALKENLTRRVYDRLRGAHAAPAENPRWVACRAELGREPTETEFILWCHRKDGEGL